MKAVKVLLLLILITVPAFAGPKLEAVNGEARRDYIHRAQVWRPTDIPKMDVLQGPSTDISVPPGREVACRYVEWPKDYKPSGATPKFLCKLKSGAVVRVKFGKDTREVYSEVAATRLLWALGFYADEMYPVRLKCLGCPEKDPTQPKKNERRINRVIDPATIERKFPGAVIEESEDEGWKWSELSEVKEEEGGAPHAQIEALKLLAVFLQHSDNKPEQQRLACLPEDLQDSDGDGVATCGRPIMMIQDLGATFGKGNATSSDGAKMDYDGWKSADIWNHWKENEHLVQKQEKVCYGNLTNSKAAGPEGLSDPEILEDGRKFLADLLNQLTSKQINDLFLVARAEKLGATTYEKGSVMAVTASDWVAAFNKKRDEINQRECSVKPAKVD